MVKYESIDITEKVLEYINGTGFVFNNSIAKIKENIYLISVRHFAGDKYSPKDEEKNPHKNYQHPWKSFWKGESNELKEDITYIFLIKLENNNVKIIDNPNFPLKIDGQDLRIFEFYNDENTASYVLTYNKPFQNPDIIIKGGKTCEEGCYIIGWNYLVIDLNNNFSNSLLDSSSPLCSNISNRLDKNWSLWNLKYEDKTVPMISYMLTPDHIAFNWELYGINKQNNTIDGGYKCRLLTPEEIPHANFFFNLEKYYDNNLFVSLSTPAYLEEKNTFLAVGHIKAKIRGGYRSRNTELTKFLKWADPDYLHPTFIYFMFFYRFKPEIFETDEENKLYTTNSREIIFETTKKRFIAPITEISPAFIVDNGVNYLLNFPSGLVINEDNILVSYGNGDSEARILKLNKIALNKIMKNYKPHNYPFMYLDEL